MNRERTTIVDRSRDMVLGRIGGTGENMVESDDNTVEAAQCRTVGFYKYA